MMSPAKVASLLRAAEKRSPRNDRPPRVKKPKPARTRQAPTQRMDGCSRCPARAGYRLPVGDLCMPCMRAYFREPTAPASICSPGRAA